MPIIANLLSGITPYVLGAMVLLAAVSTGFGLWERSKAADARAQVATQTATINEQRATLAIDARTIAELERIKDLDETVIAETASRETAVQKTLVQAETKVNHVEVPTDCQGADARDAAALDGLRAILGATAAVDPDRHDQGIAAKGAARLPAAP